MNSLPPTPPPFGDPTQIREQNRRAILKGVGCSVGGCLVIVVLIVALIVGIVFFILRAIKSSEGAEEALAALRNTPAAMEVLGEPVELGWWVTGSANTHNGDKTVDLTLPVNGPRGAGVLRAVGRRAAGGKWQFETLNFQPDGSKPLPLHQP